MTFKVIFTLNSSLYCSYYISIMFFIYFLQNSTFLILKVHHILYFVFIFSLMYSAVIFYKNLFNSFLKVILYLPFSPFCLIDYRITTGFLHTDYFIYCILIWKICLVFVITYFDSVLFHTYLSIKKRMANLI